MLRPQLPGAVDRPLTGRRAWVSSAAAGLVRPPIMGAEQRNGNTSLTTRTSLRTAPGKPAVPPVNAEGFRAPRAMVISLTRPVPHAPGRQVGQMAGEAKD